jgi:hypothetical protein
LLVTLSVAAGVEPPVVSYTPPASLQLRDGPDILIREGTIVATAADYEMDGTMWVAFTLLEDSTTMLYKSTDHGVTWEYRLSTRLQGDVFDKLGLVVGEGDSGFVHLFFITSPQNGDLWDVRYRDGGIGLQMQVAAGPDTIRDFAVCRDYTGSDYWLYAVVTAPEVNSPRAMRFLRSSTYGREWSPTDSFTWRADSPHLSAGPGSYIYCAFTHGDTLGLLTNVLFLSPGSWYGAFMNTNEEMADAVIASDFTLPESSATVWALWSQDYQNSSDWDIKYSYSTDGGRGWQGPDYLASSTAADEAHPDMRNYTSLGNQYINVSYISELGPDRRVYRQYASAANPTGWSDTLRINEGNAGTGSEVRPKLCYTPGAPFTGAGAVFVGAGLNGCWWNAPYPVSVEAPEKATVATGLDVRPRIGRGPFHIWSAGKSGSVTIHDRAGRRVRALELLSDGRSVWDGRDASGARVAAGIYFVRMSARTSLQSVKLVVR